MVGVRLPDDQRQRSSAALLADATGGLAALDHCVELSCCAGDLGDKRVCVQVGQLCGCDIGHRCTVASEERSMTDPHPTWVSPEEPRASQYRVGAADPLPRRRAVAVEVLGAPDLVVRAGA